MAWNGDIPIQANWSGNPQFAGSEELYITPNPPTTATNPSIGIVDGNIVPLPTAYNTMNVETLTSTTINNSGNIQTATINGNPVLASAELWSTFDAIHDVVGRGAAVTGYVPRQLYGTGLGLPNLASFGTPYQNYTALQTGGTINPANTLDAWNSATLYNPSPILPIFGATYNGIQYLAVTIHDNDPPPSANWRLANYDNTYSYGVGDLAYLPTTKIWYVRTTAGSGNPPPNASFWSVYTFWGIYDNDLFPTFDIRGFANVNCGTVNNVTTNSELDVNTATANTETTNATSTINIGTETSGGTLNVGAGMVSPTAYPDVNIGNSTISRCAVKIYGDNNLAGSSAVVIKGGLTVDAGKGFETDPLTNHGIKMTCDTVEVDGVGVALVRLNMDSVNGISLITSNPIELLQNISLDALTNVKIKSGLGTYVESFEGLYVSGLTDFNDGRIFTNRINPPYAGATEPYNDAILLIDGRTALLDDSIRTGVQIDDGTTWTTQTLNATTINSSNITNNSTTDTQLLKVSQSTFVPLPYDALTPYVVNQLVIYNVDGLLYICVNATTGNDPTDTAYWRLADWSDAISYEIGDIVFLSDGFNFYISLVGGGVNIDNYPLTTLGTYWDYYYGLTLGLSKQGIQFKPQAGDTITKSIVKEVGDPKLYVVTTTQTNADISKGEIFTVPAMDNLNMNGHDIENVVTITSGPDYGGTLNFRTPLTGGGGMNAIIGGSFQLFGGNTNGGGTVYNGDVKFETGNNVEFKSNNGGEITLNNNIAKEVSRPDNRNITITAGKNGEFSSVGSLVLNSSTADTSLGASTTIAITSTTGLVSLTAGTGQTVNINSNLNMTNKNIANANTITGQTNLTLATTGTDSIRLYPASGFIECNRPILMGGASGIFQVPTISANATLSLATGGGANNQAIVLNNNNITGANSITGTTTLTLASASNGNINLSPNGTGTIVASKTLNMNTNAISGVTTLNGRNLFAYGNFYNDATQTLTATGTATRVKMNTSLNNNLITLDSVTNIGRLTFTNAGVYHVVWNAYLLHGFGGTIKSVIWIRLNGTDVAGSGKTENNDASQNETNLTSSSLVSVTAGQYIEFYWAANSLNVPLTSVAASSPYPATPSFSCTISIVG